MSTVVLIACSASKVDTSTGPVKARDLYTGALFRWSVELAEKLGLPFAILSAEYGVVDPDALLSSYEHKLDKREAADWGRNVAGQLHARFGLDVTFLVLAPSLYTSFMAFGAFVCELPLKGLGIGSQRGWLRRQLAAREAA